MVNVTFSDDRRKICCHTSFDTAFTRFHFPHHILRAVYSWLGTVSERSLQLPGFSSYMPSASVELVSGIPPTIHCALYTGLCAADIGVRYKKGGIV